MATQEQWREHSYQRWLGTQGIKTWTQSNDEGYREHLRVKQQRERAWEDFTIPTYPPPPTLPSLGSDPTVPRMEPYPYNSTSTPSKMSDGGFWKTLFELSAWLVSRVPPARMIATFGSELAESESRVKLAHAFIFAALVAVWIYATHGVPAAAEAWTGTAVLLGAAGVAGWFFPMFLGSAIFVGIHLAAIVLFFTGIAVAIGIVVRIVSSVSA